jgi:hypothetical protein
MNFFDLDDKIVAAIIGAAGTMLGALIQLRVAWKKEQAARARGTPPTKKSRRGPVLAVFLLLLAAGVGGFAFSQYMMAESARESAALREELQTRLAQISASAERLEQAHLNNSRVQPVIEPRRAEPEQHGTEAIASSGVGPCRPRASIADGCSEQDAARVALCASMPASATITEVALYARPENSTQPWAESRVLPGQDVGRVRFAEPADRAEADQTKHVCTTFSSWDSERAHSARIVVKYTPAAAPREVSHTATAPTTERIQ